MQQGLQLLDNFSSIFSFMNKIFSDLEDTLDVKGLFSYFLKYHRRRLCINGLVLFMFKVPLETIWYEAM